MSSTPSPALPPQPPLPGASPRARWFGGVFADPQLNFLLAVNLLIVLAATALSGGQFIGIDNLQSMAGQLPELGFLAIGVALAMMSGSGGIDLSGIALANLAGVVAAQAVPLAVDADAQPLAFTAAFCAVTLAVGALGGAVNGLLISKVGLTPILATLGTQLAFTGIAVIRSGGPAVRLPYVETLAALGNDTVAGIPIGFAAFTGAVVLLGIALRQGRFGTRLLLLGTNPKAARYAGISTTRVLMTTYIASGVFAACAGILIASRTSSVKWDYGSSYLLITILIAVMAGVRPEGGYGRIVCLFFSATALQVAASTFNLLGLSNFFRDCAWGALLLLFLAVSRRRAMALRRA